MEKENRKYVNVSLRKFRKILAKLKKDGIIVI